MRAVQKHTTLPESQQHSTSTNDPVQRHESLRSVDYDTAVQRLAPVQAKEDNAAVHSAAQRGTSGGGGSLPYLGQIQKSFGGHDVSGIKSHTGGKASEACDSMGAEAYASGQDVAFKGQPDLHTAAHEAAHIVQQRAGVQLSGGVGQAGDSYEKNADEVADRVVQGKSAEDLLGGGGYGGAGAIQRSIQMKGGFLDRLKSFFLEAKLTGPQQQVAKILAEKHGVDVSGLPTSTFTSLYNDATAGNPKLSPDKIAANMASAARDQVGEAKKPTQKKDSSSISGHAIQRKESRHVQGLKVPPVVQTKITGAPARTEELPQVALAHDLKEELLDAKQHGDKRELQTLLAAAKKVNQRFAALWMSTWSAMNRMQAEGKFLRGEINKAHYSEATLVSLNNWMQSFDEVLVIYNAAKSVASIDVKKLIKDVQKIRSGVQGTWKQVQNGNAKKTEAGANAIKKHYGSIKGVYDQLEKNGQSLGTAFGDVSGMLQGATLAPTEQQALADLDAFSKAFDPGELVKDKKNIVTNLSKTGLKSYQLLMQYATAKGVAQINSRRDALEAALLDVNSAENHATTKHRAVNHGYWSLTDTLRGYDAKYHPPHQLPRMK